MGEADRHRASSWDDFGDDPESRVVAFEPAAAMADAGTLSEADAASLYGDYLRRLQALGMRVSGDAKRAGGGSYVRVTPQGVTQLVWWGLMILLATVGSPFVAPQFWGLIVGVGVFAGLVVIWRFLLVRRYRVRWKGTHVEILSELDDAMESIEQRRCIDCRYSLVDLHPQIANLPYKGMDLGPRACPECGTRWPLVPGRVG